jgi:hypothetical protein
MNLTWGGEREREREILYKLELKDIAMLCVCTVMDPWVRDKVTT